MSEDSFSRQKKDIEDKRENYQRFVNKFKSMTWKEINEDFVNNHPHKYFEQVKQLNVPFKVKLELMGKYFQQQKELMQGQQYSSPIELQIGSPINLGSTVLDKNSPNKDNANLSSFEVTRSGRITKKPAYYQEDFAEKFDDLKIKSSRKPYEKKENNEKPSEPKKEPNKAVRGVLSKHEQSRNALFDSLLMDNNKLDLNNSEEKSNENCNSIKTIVKRKHEDVQEIADKNDLDDFQSKIPSPKKHKGNRFFKSKNQIEDKDTIICDSSDNEDPKLIEMPVHTKSQTSGQSSKVETQLDTLKLGRVSPPVISKQRKTFKKTNFKETEIVCPICNIYYHKNEITVSIFLNVVSR